MYKINFIFFFELYFMLEFIIISCNQVYITNLLELFTFFFLYIYVLKVLSRNLNNKMCVCKLLFLSKDF